MHAFSFSQLGRIMRWISLAVRSGVGFKQVVSYGGLACLGLCWTGLRRLDVRETSWIGPMHVLFRLDLFLWAACLCLSCLMILIDWWYMLLLYLFCMIVHTCLNMSFVPNIRLLHFTCFQLCFAEWVINLLADGFVAVCRRKWLQGRTFWNCLVSPGTFQLLLLTVSSLVDFQVKSTGTPSIARGRPCYASFSGLLCVRREPSHFASTKAYKYKNFHTFTKKCWVV